MGWTLRARTQEAQEASALIGTTSPLHIAAVVIHDGGGFDSSSADAENSPVTPETILDGQTRRPDAVLDFNSPGYRGAQDLSRSLRSGLLGDRRKARKTLTPGPGQVPVTSLWRQLERQLPDGLAAENQWLWLLPAGAVPAADALERLEERVLQQRASQQSSPGTSIFGAKQLNGQSPSERPRVLNVGLWRAHSGETVTLTEPEELDQGQYDGRGEVPAVSAHGMLICARTFGDLGGFDPSLGQEAAAVDLCLRAAELGESTQVVPDAEIWRSDPEPRDLIHRFGGAVWLPAAARRDQLRVHLARTAWWASPAVWLIQWVQVLLRVFGLLAGKAPDAAASQFSVSVATLLNLAAVVRIRIHRRRGLQAYQSRLKADSDAHPAPLQLVRVPLLSRDELRDQRRNDSSAETIWRESESTEKTRRWTSPLVVGTMLAVLTVLSLLVNRDLLTAGALGGGAALPAPATVVESWNQLISLLGPDSLGERAAADPFSVVVLLLSVISFGHASVVLLWVVILALPLAALTAWWASGTMTTTLSHRLVVALFWALLPVLQTSSGQANIGTVLAHLLLPVLVWSVVRTVHITAAGIRRGRAVGLRSLRVTAGWEAAAVAALLLVVVTAAAPVLLVPAVVGLLVCGAFGSRACRCLLVVPLPAVVSFLPALISAWHADGRVTTVLLSAPGQLTTAAESGAVAPYWQQMLGFPRAFDPAAGLSGAGALSTDWLPELFGGDYWSLRVALLIGAPLVALALLALAGLGQRRVVLIAGASVLGLGLWSVVTDQLAVGVVGGEPVPADPAPLVSAMMLCLLVMVLSAITQTAITTEGLRSFFPPAAVSLLALSLAASGGLWAAPRVIQADGASSPSVTAVNQQEQLRSAGSVRTVPSTAADLATGPASLRTLVLSTVTGAETPEVTARVVSGEGATLTSQRSSLHAVSTPLTVSENGWLSDVLALGGDDNAEDSEPLPVRNSHQRLAELTAALVTPGADRAEPLMAELGIGSVVVQDPEDPLVTIVDTASSLTGVGETDAGMLWRADASADGDLARGQGLTGVNNSWARLLDVEGQVVGLLPAAWDRVATDLTELRTQDGEPLNVDEEQNYYVELATEYAAGWQATLGATELEVTREAPTGSFRQWNQVFSLPGELLAEAMDAESAVNGDLVIQHHPWSKVPMLSSVALVLLLCVLVAIPLPRSWRLHPVLPVNGEGERS